MKKISPRYLVLTPGRVGGIVMLTFLLGLVFAVIFDWLHAKLLREEERVHLYEHLVQDEDMLEARLRHRVEMTSGLASYIQLHPELTQSEFQTLAENLVEASGGLIGVQLLKEDRVSHVFPVRHLEVLKDKTIEELYAIGDDGSLVPTPLLQSAVPEQNMLISRNPIRVSLTDGGGDKERQDLWGYVILLLDVEDVIEEAGLLEDDSPVAVALEFRPADESDEAIVFGDETVLADNPIQVTMTLPGGEWILSGVDRGWREIMAYQTQVMRIFSLLVVLLITCAVYLLLVRIRLRGLISDVEAKKRAGEQQFAFLIREAMVDSIGVFDRDGKIWDFNDMAARNLGYSRDELMDLTVFDIDKGTPESELRKILAAMEPGHISHVRTLHRRKDGTLCPVEVRLGVMATHDGVRILAVSRDITAQRRYEEELENLNRDKDKFFGIIAHDLRGPLGGFLGMTEMLVRDMNAFSQEELEQLIGEMNKAGKSLFGLLEDLLDWSRLRMGRIEVNKSDVPIRDAVESSLSLMSGNARLKEIELRNECDPELMVRVDMEMLATILRNLLSNAIKFTPRKGYITVRAYREGESAVIEVEDTGVGMRPEQVATLFKIGGGTRREGTEKEKGSGFGLILCRELLLRNAGDMHIRSELGKGSVFSFSLPAVLEGASD